MEFQGISVIEGGGDEHPDLRRTNYGILLNRQYSGILDGDLPMKVSVAFAAVVASCLSGGVINYAWSGDLEAALENISIRRGMFPRRLRITNSYALLKEQMCSAQTRKKILTRLPQTLPRLYPTPY